LARAFLAEERRKAAPVLLGVPRHEFDELLDEVADLPTLDVALQVDLPRLLTPELQRLRVAIDGGDEEAFETALDPALRQLDTPERRAALARIVLGFRDGGRIDARLAAMAVVDLWIPRSVLFRASVIQALAVSVGAARTPSGLLVVSR
jgi:hypothetical protein